MSMSDPLGDMLTRIRNAQRARHRCAWRRPRKLRANVLDVLKREGFIRGYLREELRPGVAQLRIELKYNEGEPVIKEITASPSRAAASIPRSRNCRGSMPAWAFPSSPRRAA
jgi:small subunit ribosomal protein S8